MTNPSSPLIAFMGGCPRSGLTLLRRLLSMHPDVYCGSDTVLAPSLVMQWKSFSDQLGRLHETAYNLPPDQVQAIMATLLSRLIRPKSNQIVVDKSALNVAVFSDLAQMAPTAKFIHVVRDGRDAASSLLSRDWTHPITGAPLPYVTDPNRALVYWAQLVQAGLAAQDQISTERLHMVRYEDLVRRPKRTLKALFNFLGLKLPADIFEYPNQPIELVGTERDSLPLLNQPISTQRIGVATEDILSRVERSPQIQSLLERLGY